MRPRELRLVRCLRWASLGGEESTRYMAKHVAERAKVVKAMASTLQRTAMKIVTIVNKDKEHIPPITTSETNPFPYQIELNPRLEGWGKSIGIF